MTSNVEDQRRDAGVRAECARRQAEGERKLIVGWGTDNNLHIYTRKQVGHWHPGFKSTRPATEIWKGMIASLLVIIPLSWVWATRGADAPDMPIFGFFGLPILIAIYGAVSLLADRRAKKLRAEVGLPDPM